MIAELENKTDALEAAERFISDSTEDEQQMLLRAMEAIEDEREAEERLKKAAESVPYADLKTYFENLTPVEKASILIFQKLLGSDPQACDLGNELLEKFRADTSRDTLRDDEADGDYMAGVLHGMQLGSYD